MNLLNRFSMKLKNVFRFPETIISIFLGITIFIFGRDIVTSFVFPGKNFGGRNPLYQILIFLTFSFLFTIIFYLVIQILERMFPERTNLVKKKISSWLLLLDHWKKRILWVIVFLIIATISAYQFYIDALRKTAPDLDFHKILTFYDSSELIFLISICFFSIGVGLFLSGCSLKLDLPPVSLFLAGICSTPYLVGYCMLVLASVFPGAPKNVFVFSIPMIGFVLILVFLKNIKLVLADSANMLQNYKKNLTLFISFIAFFLVINQIIAALLVNGRTPLFYQDTNVYRSMALPFAEKRTLSAIPPFDGVEDGSFMRSSHNFTFPAYLSYAMMVGGDPVGFPSDRPVNDAIQITLIYFILGIFGVGWLTRSIYVPLLAVTYCFLYPFWGDFSLHGSRDAFSVISLLIFFIVLFGLFKRLKNNQITLLELVLIFFCSSFCIAGHALGVIFAFIFLAGWILITFRPRKTVLINIFCVGLIFGLGIFSGSRDYIQSMVKYGTIRFSATSTVVKGTVYEEPRNNYLDSLTSLDPVSNNTFDQFKHKFLRFVERDDYTIILPAMIMAFILLLNSKHKPFSLLISVTFLMMCLPVLGFFDLFGINVSNDFFKNSRYTLNIYPLAAICIALLINEVHIFIETRLTGKFQILGSLLLITVIATIGFNSLKVVRNWELKPWAYYQAVFDNTIAPTKDAILGMNENSKVLTDCSHWSYYFANKNIQILFTLASRDIFTSSNSAELSDVFRNHDIGIVALKPGNIRRLWINSPLMEYLENPSRAELIIDDVYVRVYKLKYLQQ